MLTIHIYCTTSNQKVFLLVNLLLIEKNRMKNDIPINSINAILFDAGHTLNYPTSGHWYVPPNHMAFFKKELGALYDRKDFDRAFGKANDYLEAHHFVETEQQEYEQFIIFYQVFFHELNYSDVPDALLSALANDLVYKDEKIAFFDDVFYVLPRLKPHYQLGIISDTWPSLERVFINARVRHYFSTFIISSKLGIWKPNPGMYRAALNELGIEPQEALFIDDSIENLKGAQDVGIHAILMDRENTIEATDGFHKIEKLDELLTILSL